MKDKILRIISESMINDEDYLDMIASSNYIDKEVREILSSILSNKITKGNIKGRKYINSIKKDTNIPIVSNLKNINSIIKDYDIKAYNIYNLLTKENILDYETNKFFEKDVFASNLYYQHVARKSGTKPKNEYTSKIVII